MPNATEDTNVWSLGTVCCHDIFDRIRSQGNNHSIYCPITWYQPSLSIYFYVFQIFVALFLLLSGMERYTIFKIDDFSIGEKI